MALDTGEAMQDMDTGPASAPENVPQPVAPEPVTPMPMTVDSLAFAEGTPFGSGLKAAREFLGMSLQDVSDITKIRKMYLTALEAMAVDQLPSRPFTIGYVRAYARALGIDEDMAIVRFKQDAPDPDEVLRPPVGVAKEGDPRFALVAVGGAIVLAAIVIWNVAQRAMREREAPVPIIASAPAATTTPAGPAGAVELGEALPPPVEATVPAPYVTPGLPGVEAQVTAAPTGPRALGIRAQVYGAPADQSMVTLQAARSVTMVVKTGDNKPYFAKQLLAGESWRAPMMAGLSIDVSSPEAVDVFVGGEYRGVLNAAVTPLSALAQ